jgi:hypothetical protein
VISLPDFSSLLGSPWVTLVSIGLTIVSITFAVRAWRMRKEKLICYAIRSDNIIRDLTGRFEHLQVLYGGESIRDFTATRLVFWNGGRDPICREDIPPSNRVKAGHSVLELWSSRRPPVLYAQS